jgi:hypothetical protein
MVLTGMIAQTITDTNLSRLTNQGKIERYEIRSHQIAKHSAAQVFSTWGSTRCPKSTIEQASHVTPK